jgi:hypothetical protein
METRGTQTKGRQTMTIQQAEKIAKEFAEKFGCTIEVARGMLRLCVVGIADSREIDTTEYCKVTGIK